MTTHEELRRCLKTDLFDGTPWTDGDIKDLKNEIEHGRSLESIAEFLCRSGSANEVQRKAAELGPSLNYSRRRSACTSS